MSRQLRIEVENGWYHVVNRGIDGRLLFPDARANEHFLELLQRMPARFDLRIHAFVLMGNHYHLQIETLQPNLSRAVQWLNLSFSTWYNHLNSRRGPLFQGRFKAVLHDPQESALSINRYIHLNPVRMQSLGGHEGRADAQEYLASSGEEPSAELVRARVEMLNTYPWSSYPAYAGRAKKPEWLTTEYIHALFGRSPVQTFRSAYRRQLEQMAALGKWQDSWKASVKASNETFDPGLGAKIIAAMGLHVPIDLRPEIDGWAARGGVISRRDLVARLGRIEDRPEWAEAAYLTVHHTGVSYTTETPKPFPIKARVEAQIAAVETLMNALQG